MADGEAVALAAVDLHALGVTGAVGFEIGRDAVLGARVAIAADVADGPTARAVLETDGAPVGGHAGLLAHAGAAGDHVRHGTQRQDARSRHNVVPDFGSRSIENERPSTWDRRHGASE